jgi:hypothetical protein
MLACGIILEPDNIPNIWIYLLTFKHEKMKTRIVAFVFAMVCMFAVAPAFNDVQAQGKQKSNVGQLVSGLINVNIGAIQVDVALDNVLNNFTLVNVENVLNNNDVDILNNVLNNSPIASNNSEILTNLLQGANILTENQVVVGVLGGTQIVFQNL